MELVLGSNRANGPPLAQSDSYSTPQDTPLTVPSGNGVLGNDIEPEGGRSRRCSALRRPRDRFNSTPTGRFSMCRRTGYSGLVHFTYQASDFTQLSNISTVTLAVGRVGDYDHNGRMRTRSILTCGGPVLVRLRSQQQRRRDRRRGRLHHFMGRGGCVQGSGAWPRWRG